MRPPSTVPSDIILQTTHLGKQFKKRWAVKDLNLEVYGGDIFGFLGPNGAGKSTTIRMIFSLIRPTQGEVKLFGHSLSSQRFEALRRVGGIVEKPDFYLYLSGKRNLEIVGALHGGVGKKRILEVLDLVGLKSRADEHVKTYSHGMKQRLGIAAALLNDPELIVLDEPTNGLDPQGMKEVRELILHLSRDRHKTVFLSSHLLSEIEMVANRMAIINKGQLVTQGEVSALLSLGEQYLVLQADPKPKVRSILRSERKFVRSFKEHDGRFEVAMRFDDVPALNKALVRRGVRVKSLIPHRSLEDYFLSLTEGDTIE